jgi:ATP-dependent protease ClpP protease subunit
VPNWKNLVDEVNTLKASGSAYDVVRRKYLRDLHEHTGRNVIVYYSGWLQKPQLNTRELGDMFSINDNDKNGFMATIHQLDRSKGLDLLLHTPGGSISAAESLVDYLRSMFDTNIRAIIPQLAMSAGTMIACACKEIVMGKQSSLGPIDPQLGGLAAHGIVEEFNQARDEILKDPNTIPLWQPILAQYDPTLVGDCKKAIALSGEMVKEWLMTGMFQGKRNAAAKAGSIITALSDHATTKTHDRHLSIKMAKKLGLVVSPLEKDDQFQDLVLSVHHACILTLTETLACKIIENHTGATHLTLVAVR